MVGKSPIGHEPSIRVGRVTGRDIFHVLMLRKYVADPTHMLEQPPMELERNLQYEEQPVKIIDSQVKQLRSKTIPLVKV